MIIDLIANIIQNIIFFNCYINKSRWNPNKRIQIKSIKKKLKFQNWSTALERKKKQKKKKCPPKMEKVIKPKHKN